jgi:methionine biosynthesis protein MetW
MPNGTKPFDHGAADRLMQFVMSTVDPSLASGDSARLAEFVMRLNAPAPRPLGADGRPTFRWQDDFIERYIPGGSSVLDLGCGGGQLLATLRDRSRVRGQGVELSPEGVAQCVERGVPVIQSDLDEGLDSFGDGSFDYVILEETLQTLHRPVPVLEGMLRVSARSIVSFPNFAYWRVRMGLAINGRMPVTAWLPYNWYDTPNIHLFTLQDFFDWADDNGVQIHESVVLSEGVVRSLADQDNLFAEEVVLVFGKKDAPADAAREGGAP